MTSAAGAFIMKIIYGYNIRPHSEDPLVSLADLTLQQFSMAIVPGMWLVDVIPARRWITLDSKIAALIVSRSQVSS